MFRKINNKNMKKLALFFLVLSVALFSCTADDANPQLKEGEDNETPINPGTETPDEEEPEDPQDELNVEELRILGKWEFVRIEFFQDGVKLGEKNDPAEEEGCPNPVQVFKVDRTYEAFYYSDEGNGCELEVESGTWSIKESVFRVVEEDLLETEEFGFVQTSDEEFRLYQEIDFSIFPGDDFDVDFGFEIDFEIDLTKVLKIAMVFSKRE